VDYRLRISLPSLPEIAFYLRGQGPWVVGSSAECDFPLRARGVSRRHLELRRDGGGALAFKDLGSTNGTIVNGKRSEGGPLPAGTLVGLGSASFVVEEASTEQVVFHPEMAAVSINSFEELLPALAAQVNFKEEAPFSLSGLSRFVGDLLKGAGGGDPWPVLCGHFAQAHGCQAAKCYVVVEDGICMKAVWGDFPDATIPPPLAQACALMSQAASFEKGVVGGAPIMVFSLPVRVKESRCVFLGVVPRGGDPIRRRPEAVAAFPLLARLVLTWMEELERKDQAVEALRENVKRLEQSMAGRCEPGAIIGRSPVFLEALERAEKVAPTDATVLLLGETGTGKELFARRIHELSKRAKGPFVPVNCASIPEPLLEAELFGARKGAYTDLRENKTGLFDMASGGTLFLDEIADMPLSLQPKLLRVLDDKLVMPLGESRSHAADVRILAATNHDVRELLERGRLRLDLYYRLSGMAIEIPPLRERPGDAALLANVFLARANKQFGRDVKGFEEGALAELCAHAWPGNVRQLLGVVMNLVLYASGPVITAQEARELLGGGKPATTGDGFEPWRLTWTSARAAFEREFFKRRLEAHDGSLAALAREMGIARTNLHVKLKKLGLEGGGIRDQRPGNRDQGSRG